MLTVRRRRFVPSNSLSRCPKRLIRHRRVSPHHPPGLPPAETITTGFHHLAS
jgi:hypothetical protein